MPDAPVLRCESLSKNFGGIIAVNDLSFALLKDEILGLIGPNGAGKTTVFNLITGFYKPSSGAIYLENKLISGLTPPEIVSLKVARTFQNIRLFQDLSVLDNVRTMLYRHARYNLAQALARTPAVRAREKEIYDQAFCYLEEVGLSEKAHVRAAALPYGLQRKLEIARALALGPRILLLDEPAAGMNPDEALSLSGLIVDLKKKHGLTIILIEHHMDVVMRICERVLVMNFGGNLALGTPEEIQANPEVIRAYLGDEFKKTWNGERGRPR